VNVILVFSLKSVLKRDKSPDAVKLWQRAAVAFHPLSFAPAANLAPKI
jgi:hypothetical protein